MCESKKYYCYVDIGENVYFYKCDFDVIKVLNHIYEQRKLLKSHLDIENFRRSNANTVKQIPTDVIKNYNREDRELKYPKVNRCNDTKMNYDDNNGLTRTKYSKSVVSKQLKGWETLVLRKNIKYEDAVNKRNDKRA